MGWFLHLCAFIGLSLTFHQMGHKLAPKIVKGHHAALVAATLAHPGTIEGIKEFTIHYVIHGIGIILR